MDLGHSQIKNWGIPKLFPLAQAPLNLPASPMLNRGRSPECRRSSTPCPHQLRTKTRCAPLGPRAPDSEGGGGVGAADPAANAGHGASSEAERGRQRTLRSMPSTPGPGAASRPRSGAAVPHRLLHLPPVRTAAPGPAVLQPGGGRRTVRAATLTPWRSATPAGAHH